jgi:hypothetical protein
MAVPEPCNAPTDGVVSAGLPAPIRLLPPPPPKTNNLLCAASKNPPTKGPPPPKAAEPQLNQFFADLCTVQDVSASPDPLDPHGSLLF